MEDQQIVERRARQAEAAGKFVRRIDREARAEKTNV